jgi:DNA-binding CsgD family transcriptional regulator
VSLLLWRGEAADAVAVATREWDRVMETADALQIALAASTSLEAAAALAEAGRQQRDLSAVAAAGQLAGRALADAERAVAESGLAETLGARREAELHLETARAHLARSRGRSSPARWARLAEAWSAVPVPYRQAKARWWQALASLQGTGDRRAAREALLEAWRIAGDLPAHPLRRALADLARRARITLPGASPEDLVPIATVPLVPVVGPADRATDDDGSGPDRRLVAVGPGPREGVDPPRPSIEDRVGGTSDTAGTAFGLSPREMEVLLLVSEGQTNREIGERLFISDRTVGVHVRSILGKLGVSSRTQAAGTAIRLGLTEHVPAPTAEPGTPPPA